MARNPQKPPRRPPIDCELASDWYPDCTLICWSHIFMISNIASASPTIPAETSVLGNLSSPDSTSSFADQLASAVGQAGSNPQNTSGSQRQNLDAPVQYSFFDYMMGTPSGAASPATAPAASAAGARESATSSTEWLSAPYYTPPEPVFVSWEAPPGVINTTAAPETDLQNLASQFINDPVQFVWGGVPASTPQELVDNFVSYAQSRVAIYPAATPAGYDPVATGTKYANLVMDSLKRIQYDTVGSSPFASIYDAWVAGVNTFPGSSGAGSTVS